MAKKIKEKQYNADSEGAISAKGVRVNNLKNIDVEIERGAMTVVTGVSGSGKGMGS